MNYNDRICTAGVHFLIVKSVGRDYICTLIVSVGRCP